MGLKWEGIKENVEVKPSIEDVNVNPENITQNPENVNKDAETSWTYLPQPS